LRGSVVATDAGDMNRAGINGDKPLVRAPAEERLRICSCFRTQSAELSLEGLVAFERSKRGQGRRWGSR
jgi:hypothetical protein